MRELFGEYGIICIAMVAMVICLIFFLRYFYGTDAIVGELLILGIDHLI